MTAEEARKTAQKYKELKDWVYEHVGRFEWTMPYIESNAEMGLNEVSLFIEVGDVEDFCKTYEALGYEVTVVDSPYNGYSYNVRLVTVKW